MLPSLQLKSPLQREETADILFRPSCKGPVSKTETGARYSPSKQLINVFVSIILVIWVAWVTCELLSQRCTEQPGPLAVCSIVPVSLQLRIATSAPAILPSGGDLPLRVSEVELRINKLESMTSPPRNFAAGGDGALILKAFTSSTFVPFSKSTPSIFRSQPSPLPPSTILDDSAAIGRCWEFAGGYGQVGIGLTEDVHIRSISLNHVRPSLVMSTSAQKAPRDFLLWGLYPSGLAEILPDQMRPPSYFSFSQPFPTRLSPSGQFILLVNGSYDTSSQSTHQSFTISPSLQRALRTPTAIVVLEITSNWGAASTCIYSVGIHGEASRELE